MANGTGACAAAGVAYKLGLTSNKVIVHMPGGELQVEIGDDWEAYMTGDVFYVAAVKLIERVESVHVGTTKEVQELLESCGSTPLVSGASLADLIRRPELSYEILASVDKMRPELKYDVAEQVNINIKYEGYIKRQKKQVEQFKKLEKKRIPADINYEEVQSLRLEAKQKLSQIRPASIGQASRISGVSPADISVLLVYLESR